MIHCYTLRVLVDDFAQDGLGRLHRTGAHWATVNVDFDENKFRTSALLLHLKSAMLGQVAVADGTLVATIDHGPLDC